MGDFLMALIRILFGNEFQDTLANANFWGVLNLIIFLAVVLVLFFGLLLLLALGFMFSFRFLEWLIIGPIRTLVVWLQLLRELVFRKSAAATVGQRRRIMRLLAHHVNDPELASLLWDRYGSEFGTIDVFKKEKELEKVLKRKKRDTKKIGLLNGNCIHDALLTFVDDNDVYVALKKVVKAKNMEEKIEAMWKLQEIFEAKHTLASNYNGY